MRNGALHGESFLRVVVAKGKVSIQNNKIEIDKADEVTLYLTAATNYKNYKDVSGDPVAICNKALRSINGKTYNEIKAAHIKEYQKYFNTFSINLGNSENEKLPTDGRIEKVASSNDPALVALYLQYGRYLLISSSRPGTYPANLQGIWNDKFAPPWGSKYTTNINAEMNYWPSELLNLSPMHQPMFKMIEELAQAGKETAKDYYNAPGWVLHHNTDIWRGTAPYRCTGSRDLGYRRRVALSSIMGTLFIYPGQNFFERYCLSDNEASVTKFFFLCKSDTWKEPAKYDIFFSANIFQMVCASPWKLLFLRWYLPILAN